MKMYLKNIYLLFDFTKKKKWKIKRSKKPNFYSEKLFSSRLDLNYFSHFFLTLFETLFESNFKILISYLRF